MMRVYLPLLLMLAWLPYGEVCGDPAAMRCTSGALLSDVRSGAIVVSADVRVDPAPDGRFWAGLALNASPQADDHYISAAIEHNIMPYAPGVVDTDGPAAVLLADGADHCCAVLGPADPAQVHHLSVSYDGSSGAVACVDGACEPVAISLDRYQIELVCAGVSPGEPGQNDVGCAFSNIAISPA